MDDVISPVLLCTLAFLLLPHMLSSLPNPTPRSCSDPTRVCTSFLAIKSSPNLTLPLLQSMFDVLPSDVTVDDPTNPDNLFIRKNCSCSPSAKTASYEYITNTTFTVGRGKEGGLVHVVTQAYGPLATVSNSSGILDSGAVVAVRLLCGCSNGLWNYFVSWIAEIGDSVEVLASRFGVRMDDIERTNGLRKKSDLVVGDVYYIPLDSVPGKPYPFKPVVVSPSLAPVPVPPSNYPQLVNQKHFFVKSSFGWTTGSIGAVLLIVIFLILGFLFKSYFVCFQASRNVSKGAESTSHKLPILQRSSFCYSSGSHSCFVFGKKKEASIDTCDHQIDIPKRVVVDAFNSEKPIIFSYQEIVSATDGLSEANLLGHGSKGSVYYGVLRDQEVAIKRMTVTKTKEFMAELKILCRVHHSSLVELIGYGASEDELFIIYEYAQKGSVNNHLHDLQNKGYASLSWIIRVQIAVDAAKGLEYLHEHTITHYVHRDIKTSNILLDNVFRAKISDFGLAKLIPNTKDEEIAATKVVGTFGYLSPEYLRDGMATTKSDVYAFGVVLLELISGKEATTPFEGSLLPNFERRSLASIMLTALKNSTNSTNMSSLEEQIDPNMSNFYPHDCVYKMAILAKQCVDEDPILRPDMRQVVIALSRIYLSSIEWEATLAGNSRVFTGVFQGR